MVASARLGALRSHLRGADGRSDAPLIPSPTVVHPAPKATLRPKRIHTEEDDVEGADRPGLTAEEIAFFKENGWLAKRRLLDPAAVSVVRAPPHFHLEPTPAWLVSIMRLGWYQGVEALWAAAARLQPLLDRSDPSTWGASDTPSAPVLHFAAC